MDNRRYGIFWIRMAALYLLAGVALGNYMGASHDFALRSVHAHLNLLGWASMLGFGLVVLRFDGTLNPRLVAAQFWLHQLALPAQLLALSAMIMGSPGAGPVVGICSALIGVAVLLFAVNAWRGLGLTAARSRGQTA
jgi:hypothetical protein